MPMLADALIADMAKRPEMKPALEELHRMLKDIGGASVSARLNCMAELDGEPVPVTFAVIVGNEDEDED